MAAVTVTKVIEIDVKASADANAHLKKIAEGMRGAEEQAKNTGNTLTKMFSSIRSFTGFLVFDLISSKVGQLVLGFNALNDASKVLEQRMKMVTGNSSEAAQAFQQVIDISVRQGRELDGVAKLYEKVQRNAKALELTQAGVALVTEGVAASLRLSGASTQEANAAMTQFAQAMASGRLSGDEFRSLMENDSVLMFEFSKSLGVTMGELRKMSSEGKLTAGVMSEAMTKIGDDGKNMLQRLIDKTAELPQTFEQAITGVKASLVDLLNALTDTKEKSEGLFATIAKTVGGWFRQAAVAVREKAIFDEELARIKGEREGKPPAVKIPTESEHGLDQLRIIEESEKRLTGYMAQQARYAKEVADERAKGRNPSTGNFDKMQDVIDVENARIATARKVIELAHLRDQETSAMPTTGKKPAAPTDKDPKGRHEKTDYEKVKDMLENVQKETDMLQQVKAGVNEEVARLEASMNAAMKDSPRDPKHSIAETKALVAQAAKEMKKARGLKDDIEDEKKKDNDIEIWMREQAKASDKRLADVEEDRKRFIEMAKREIRQHDPMIGAREMVAEIQKAMFDPETQKHPEDVAALAKLINTTMDEAWERARKMRNPTQGELYRLDIQNAWKQNWEVMLDDLLDFDKSVQETVTNLVTNMLKKFGRLQLEKTLNPLFQAGATVLEGWASKMFGSADGSAWGPGGVRLFGSGGIVDGPTAFGYNGGRNVGVMGEKGTEAIMPLKRGSDGSLGVGSAPVTVNVYNSTGSKARTQERTGSSGERQIDVIIEEKVENAIGGGRMDNVLNSSFGLSRRGR